MKVLVTGGAGFVGTNQIKRLLKDTHKVVSLDNYSTGFKKKFTVGDAIKELKNNYESKIFTESDKCYTVKWMKELNL